MIKHQNQHKPINRESQHEVVVQLESLLCSRGQLVCAAESCTGGKLLAWLTDKPGASNWVWGGWVVYSNQAKLGLGVHAVLLAKHGAVSGQVVADLCRAARATSGCALALAISGIAGPGGGTPDKPVGRVWLGGSYLERKCTRELYLHGDRAAIRSQACTQALHLGVEMMGG